MLGTKLCVPSDSEFTAWLDSIESKNGIMPCEDEPEPLSDLDALEAHSTTRRTVRTGRTTPTGSVMRRLRNGTGSRPTSKVVWTN